MISKCLKLELSNKSSRISSDIPGFSFLSSKWTFLNLKLHTGAKASPYLFTSYSSLIIKNFNNIIFSIIIIYIRILYIYHFYPLYIFLLKNNYTTILFEKSGQSIVKVSYSPPSPQTLLPYLSN